MSENEKKEKKLEPSNTRCFRRSGVAPEELPKLAPAGDAWALVYTPRHCVFARVADGALSHPDLGNIDPAEAFEIRIFNADWELRWRRRGEKGAAILWAKDRGNFGGEEVEKQPAKERQTQYLLWGKVIKPPQNGWVTLGTHQVGTLHVPYAKTAMEGGHLALKAVEYFAEFDDGNMAFIGERLSGIRELAEKGGQDER